MVMSPLLPFGAAQSKGLWVAGEESSAAKAKPQDLPLLSLGSRETHPVLVLYL